MENDPVRERACPQGKGLGAALGEQLPVGAYPFCPFVQHASVALSIDSWKVRAQKCPLSVQSNLHVNYRAVWLSLLMVTQPVSGQLGLLLNPAVPLTAKEGSRPEGSQVAEKA